MIVADEQIWNRPSAPRLRQWGRALLDALFPLRCGACNTWLDGATEDPLSRLLCPDCRASLDLIEGPICPLCGQPFASDAIGDHLCGTCLAHPPVYAMARSAGIYGPPLKTLIHNLKYRDQRRMARPLGELLYRTFRRHWRHRTVDLIIPVPLHPRRLRERGFNQVQFMLRRWPQLFPASAAVPMADDILVRVRHTASQAGLDRGDRQRNMHGAFRVRRPETVTGRAVLVVDDVMTTGATVAACAAALTGSGARRVDVLTLARAL
ncbi:MAG: ComF family protein [Desulfobacterales bacterium]|jgi:ComF family protein|nr:ComF family protein [Desulfobacteraceae bacterium]MDD3992148.1 ComF family protein [Desulfobacteraceae bacterium]MDY0311816.1 ComF family protein [Desulfobacterales bacterium]